MTSRGNKHAELINFTKMQTHRKIAFCHHVVSHVHNVSTVQVIVIWNLFMIVFNDFIQKVSKLLFVNHYSILLIQAHFTNCIHSHNRKHFFSIANLFLQLKDVEIQLIEIL